ncbi:hypothetical protein PoB_003838800 [Plakobranchus ocellatus]|uniref:Uncharacterized protein n=1 Tax=Plakobranchus ocellatus TaxID=259542 RepID=A0AAV4AYF4_9GAST|nr:hypothetical protein PoB_003838800 [Plakobranchus ocellatus]
MKKLQHLIVKHPSDTFLFSPVSRENVFGFWRYQALRQISEPMEGSNPQRKIPCRSQDRFTIHCATNATQSEDKRQLLEN